MRCDAATSAKLQNQEQLYFRVNANHQKLKLFTSSFCFIFCGFYVFSIVLSFQPDWHRPHALNKAWLFGCYLVRNSFWHGELETVSWSSCTCVFQCCPSGFAAAAKSPKIDAMLTFTPIRMTTSSTNLQKLNLHLHQTPPHLSHPPSLLWFDCLRPLLM